MFNKIKDDLSTQLPHTSGYILQIYKYYVNIIAELVDARFIERSVNMFSYQIVREGTLTKSEFRYALDQVSQSLGGLFQAEWSFDADTLQFSISRELDDRHLSLLRELLGASEIRKI